MPHETTSAGAGGSNGEGAMTISQIYTYPIKSLRPIALSPSSPTYLFPTGLPHERRFMLLRHHHPELHPQKGEYENMAVAHFPQMVLFQPSFITLPDSDPASPSFKSTSTVAAGVPAGAATEATHLTVTYAPSQSSTLQPSVPTQATTTRALPTPLPLNPDISVLGLEEFPGGVNMHGSPTRAYNMGEPWNRWFSECFGFEVVLVWLPPWLECEGGEGGGWGRKVLGNLPPLLPSPQPEPEAKGWISSVAGNLLGLGEKGKDVQKRKDENIPFSDVAPYLVVTEESLAEVSKRLPEGEEMDITKFRPNIVLKGSPGGAWDEDFWGELKITGDEDDARIILTANCARCQSLNIDYTTGRPGTGESGKVLKLLMKDRRVDPGSKWSPIFGRYGFLETGRGKGKGETAEPTAPVVKIGDEVVVSRRNEERTVWEWPGLGTPAN